MIAVKYIRTDILESDYEFFDGDCWERNDDGSLEIYKTTSADEYRIVATINADRYDSVSFLDSNNTLERTDEQSE